MNHKLIANLETRFRISTVSDERSLDVQHLLAASSFFFRALASIKTGTLENRDIYPILLEKFLEDINQPFSTDTTDKPLVGISVLIEGSRSFQAGQRSAFSVNSTITNADGTYKVTLSFASEQQKNLLGASDQSAIAQMAASLNTDIQAFLTLFPYYFSLIDQYIGTIAQGFTDPMTGAVNRNGLEHDIHFLMNETQEDMVLVGVDFPGLLASLNYYGHDIGDRGLREMFQVLTARGEETSYRDVVSAFIRLWPKDMDHWESEAQGYIESRFKQWQQMPFVIPELKDVEHLDNAPTRNNLFKYINQHLQEILTNTGNMAALDQLKFAENARFSIDLPGQTQTVTLQALQVLIADGQAPDAHFVGGSLLNLDLSQGELLFNSKTGAYYSLKDCEKKALPLRVENSTAPTDAALLLQRIRAQLKTAESRVHQGVSLSAPERTTDPLAPMVDDLEITSSIFRDRLASVADIRFINRSMRFMQPYYESGKINEGLSLWLKEKGQDDLDSLRTGINLNFKPFIQNLTIITSDEGPADTESRIVVDRNVMYFRILGQNEATVGYIKLEFDANYDSQSEINLTRKMKQDDPSTPEEILLKIKENLIRKLSNEADLFNLFIREQHQIQALSRQRDFDALTGLYSDTKIKAIYDEALIHMQEGSSESLTVLFFDLVGCGAYAAISDAAVETMKKNFAEILKRHVGNFNQQHPNSAISIGVSNGEEFKVVGDNVGREEMEQFTREVEADLRSNLKVTMDIPLEQLRRAYESAEADNHKLDPAFFDNHIAPAIASFYDESTVSYKNIDVVALPKWHKKSGALIASPLESLAEIAVIYPKLSPDLIDPRFWGIGGVAIRRDGQPGFRSLESVIRQRYDYLTRIPEGLSDEDRKRRLTNLQQTEPAQADTAVITWDKVTPSE